MTITAELADGRRLEFPDGTDPAVVQMTVKRTIGASGEPETPQLSPEQIAAHAKTAGASNWRGENPIKAAALDFATGATGLGRGILNTFGAGIEKPPASRDTGWQTAGSFADPVALGIGGGVGKALPYAPVLGKGVVEGAKAFGKNLGAGALAGGAIGGLSEEGDAATGAGLGAAINVALPPALPMVAKGVGAVARIGRNLVDPWLPGGVTRAAARGANTAAGPDKQAIIDALRKGEQIVPGSIPTAGQAVAPVERAEFNALMEGVTGRTPTPYEKITQAQNEARIAALRTVGKDKAALKVAEALRSANAMRNYGTAGKQIVESDDTLNILMQRPSMKHILARASDLAEERGQVFKLGSDVPEQVVSGKIVGQSGSPLTQQTIPAQRAEFPVSSLQYMKMAMDDLIKNPERFGIGASEANAIAGTQKQFVEWLAQKSPAWESARAAYAADSSKMNPMEIGQYLEGKLVPALNDLGASSSQRAASYAQALRDAPGTMKRATGQPRFQELADALKPDQMETFSAVGRDLARTAAHERLAKAGSEKGSEIASEIMPTIPPPGFFSPFITVIRGALNRLEGKMSKKAIDRLAELGQSGNISQLAKAMEGLAPSQRRAVIDALRIAGKTAGQANPYILGSTVSGTEQ